MHFETNTPTSTVHLIEDHTGWPVCGLRTILLAGEDEGGALCERCRRYAQARVPGLLAVRDREGSTR